MLGDALDAPMAAALEALVTADELEDQLGDDLAESSVEAARHAYAQQLFRPIWTREGALSLYMAAENLFAHGLAPDDVIRRDIEDIARRRFVSEDPEERAAGDLALTAAWLRIASAVSGGLRDEGEARRSRADAPSRALLTTLLIQAGEGDASEAINALQPEHPQYQKLQRALERYRRIHADGGWLGVPDGEVIAIGDADARVPALRERLRVEGFLPPDGTAPALDDLDADALATPPGVTDAAAESAPADPALTFDATLETALMAFQERHGLEPDGVLGPNTLDALNESVQSKIDRIADTMHRWRLMERLGERHIWANIPSFTAEAWEGGKRAIAMRTIVGLPSRETPIFSDEVEYVVANPRWYAPVSIVRRDKAPRLAADPGYAARGDYRVYDRATGVEVNPIAVDWTDPNAATTYRLVQEPGEGNALGSLKIIFPNQYSVYLHGTPNEALFDEAQRAFSSGCIRLEDPERMARWLARQDTSTVAESVEQALDGEVNQRVDFTETTPVHVTYMTVTVDDDGDVSFWRDIYHREPGVDQVDVYATPGAVAGLVIPSAAPVD